MISMVSELGLFYTMFVDFLNLGQCLQVRSGRTSDGLGAVKAEV